MDLIYHRTFRPGLKVSSTAVDAIIDKQSKPGKHYFCDFFQNVVMQNRLLFCYICKT